MSDTAVQDQELTPRQREVVELYRGSDTTPGLTMEQVGDKLGLTRQRVQQILDAAGEPRRPSGPWIDREKIIQLAKETQLDVPEIAEEVGCSRDTAARVLKNAGLLKQVRKRAKQHRDAERKETLIKELRRVNEMLGHPPGWNDLKLTGYTYRPYVTAFGSMQAAYKAAGLKWNDR